MARRYSRYPYKIGVDLCNQLQDDKSVYHSNIKFNVEDLDKSICNEMEVRVEHQFMEMYKIVIKEYFEKTKMCRKVKCEHYNLQHSIDSVQGSSLMTFRTHICQHFERTTCPYYFEKLILEQRKLEHDKI